MSNLNSFKLLLVGDGGSGKTTFVKRHITGEFKIVYKPTIGVEVHPLDFWTNKGKICFYCWDTAGQEKFGGLRDGYYVGGQCGIIMFDLSDRNSYKNVPIWYRDVIRICNSVPIVLVGNKCEIKDKDVEDEKITIFKRKFQVHYIEISARLNKNYEKPFLYLIKKLLNSRDIFFTEQVAKLPPDVDMDVDKQEFMKVQAKRAADIPLPKCIN